jgi:putative Mg2+ transporter-C (MgtC) family protein
MPLSYTDIFMRLGAAVVVGAALGLDREIHKKPAGLRTMAMVALGSAVFILLIVDHAASIELAETSRVIQGVITGIGFIGAGTILHRDAEGMVHGLTTAASIWLAAGLGIGCGLALWPIVVVGTGLGVLILILAPVEARLRRGLGA